MAREEAEAAGLLHWLGEDMDERYLERLLTLLLRPEVVRQTGSALRIVYTPLHGAGRWPVEQVLRRAGFEQLYLVEAQAEPDPNFSTVKTPNPEEPDALAMAMELAEQVPGPSRAGYRSRLRSGRCHGAGRRRQICAAQRESVGRAAPGLHLVYPPGDGDIARTGRHDQNHRQQ